MTSLKDLLREKKAAIAERWLGDTLSSYAPESGAFFKRGGDRFANPVGHALRVGMEAVFEGLLRGMEPEGICRHLYDIIRIRAIHDFSASEAVSFVFLLKKAVRAELGKAAGCGAAFPGCQYQQAGYRRHLQPAPHAAELTEFDTDVDQVALFAFDVYSRCREQVYELRVGEVKRSVAMMYKVESRKSKVEGRRNYLLGP